MMRAPVALEVAGRRPVVRHLLLITAAESRDTFMHPGRRRVYPHHSTCRMGRGVAWMIAG